MQQSQPFDLSSPQLAIWFDQLLSPDLPCYNVGGWVRVEGTLDLLLWEQAIQHVAKIHEALRITLVHDGVLDRQRVLPAISFHLVIEDFSIYADGDKRALAHLQREYARPFDLHADGVLWDIRWVQASPQRGYSLFRFHHLIADGNSMFLVGKAVFDTYARLQRGEHVETSAAAPSYSAYVREDQSYLTSPRYAKDQEFWLDKFRVLPDVLIPRTGDAVRHRCDQQVWRIGRQDFEKWAEAAVELGASSTHLLVAAIALEFSRMNGWRREIVVGTPVHNRRNAAEKETVGMFASVLPLVVPIDPQQGFAATLQAVAAESRTCFRHQRFPLYELRRQLMKTPGGHARVFDVTVSVENFTAPFIVEDAHAVLEPQHIGYEAVPLSVHVRNHEKSNDVHVEFNFDPEAFDTKEIRALIERIGRLMRAALLSPQQPQWQLPWMGNAERERVLHDFNSGRQLELEPGVCAHHLFENQATRYPHACAVHDEDGRRWTYEEINARANRLARRLLALGVGPDKSVAVALPRGADLVTALLAVLKAGSAYLPLDPNYPGGRLAFMVEDSEPSVVLTHMSVLERACNTPQFQRALHRRPVIALNDPHLQPVAESSENLTHAECFVHERDLAYLIYTSGSTGQPKGVMVEHRSLVAYTLDAIRWFDLARGERVLQQNSLNFDLSLEEMWPTLASGATLVTSNEPLGAHGSTLDLSMLHVTAAHWHTLVSLWAQQPQLARERLQRVRLVNVTGDALSSTRLAQWDGLRPTHTALINTYGPTEAAISCTAQMAQFEPGQRRVSIGRPFANARLYILDSHKQPVPIGVPGEIYIGGLGVARGYLNRPDLNAQRFLPDPFVPLITASRGLATADEPRMYRSGDIGAWQADGSIDFLGRVDHQVKLNGYRVELQEVEAALLALHAVNEAVVGVREDVPGIKRMVAYYTGQPQEAAALREQLARSLPTYMLPGAYVHLPALPLTPGGKLDRAALAAPNDTALARRIYAAPRDATERTLAAIWCRILGVERIGRDDHFFDLGGDSLLAVQMLMAAQEFGIKRNVAHLFRFPTLRDFARDPAVQEGRPAPVRPQGIRTEGTQRPLFILHMQSGEVGFAYRLTKHIWPQVPIYGLPAQHNLGDPTEDFSDLAAHARDMLTSIQPRGPYRLLGWSFGGALCHEVAAQLLDAGQEVEFVGVVDTPLTVPRPFPGTLDEDVRDVAGWMPDLARGPAEMMEARARLDALPSHASWEERFDLVRTHAAEWFHVVGAPLAQMSRNDALAWVRHWRARGRARARHELRALRGQGIDVFATRESLQAFGTDLGWSRLYPPEQLRITPVAGPHALVTNEPHVASLGAAISTRLEALAECGASLQS